VKPSLTTHSWLAECHFGPDWPGRRCGAKTRRGTPCQKPALRGKNRCQPRGGKSTGAQGKRNGNYWHGTFTKEAIANRRAADARVRELARLVREVALFD
jgi:hypothetical protein